MSLLSSLHKRASPENPATNLANPDEWLIDWAGGQKGAAGKRVTPTSAMQATAVHGCVRILAESIAQLPLPLYRRLPDGGKERATDNPLYYLLHDRPNPEQSSFAFRELMVAHLALWGNFYAEIVWNEAGRIAALWPMAPWAVEPFKRDGRKLYRVRIGDEQEVLYPDEVLHIPGLGFDGLKGFSPIQMAAETIGMSLAADEFGARFFGNGSTLAGVIRHPAKLGIEGKKNLRESFSNGHAGLDKSHRVAIFEEGMEWQSIGIPPEQAQFLETRKFQITEIARIFRVPPHMLADLERATFSNIEHQSISFVVHTLGPWLRRIEQELNYTLFADRSRGTIFAEFLVEGLLRGDAAARGQFYKTMFEMGAFSVNDIRERENLNPVEDGDKRFVPLNMQLLDKAGDEPPPSKTTPEPKPENPPEEKPKEDGKKAAQRSIYEDVVGRFVRREANAARKAAKKEGFAEWIDDWYARNETILAESLTPAVRAHLAVLGSSNSPEHLAHEMAREHVRQSREALTELLDEDNLSEAVAKAVDEWAKRPGKMADAMLSEDITDALRN